MSTERISSDGGMQTSYGFKSVSGGQKQALVNEVFDKVAKRYDIMNDVMSGGMHRLWKDAMICQLSPRKNPDYRFLDVAGGTGDIAFRAVEASGRKGRGIVLDINGSMLALGQQRAVDEGLDGHVEFVEANAENLPFSNHSFDAYTIAFGIRNVPDIDKALSEAYRVLKRGGKLLVLEFSQLDIPVFDKIYDAWSFNIIPKLGGIVMGDQEPYRYLVESIRKFPNQDDFATMINRVGFSRVKYTNYTGGITALHIGWKI